MLGENPLSDSLVIMRRPNLENLPRLETPCAYELRAFRPEDESPWERIIGDAFEKEDIDGFFDARMRKDPDYFDPGSIFMICKGDEPVATASAWLRNAFGTEAGYLHKVAVISLERGKGLGYQASLACLNKMLMDGRTSAVLRTQVKRIPAIKTYLKLGFEPWLLEEEHRQNWEEVWKRLDSAIV